MLAVDRIVKEGGGCTNLAIRGLQEAFLGIPGKVGVYDWGSGVEITFCGLGREMVLWRPSAGESLLAGLGRFEIPYTLNPKT